MQLSIRDASRFMIGAAILRDMAQTNSPGSAITGANVATAALRPGPDGAGMRASIARLAEQEAAWFRSTPPHTLVSERVLHSRVQEMATLNNCNLAALATLACGAAAAGGEPQARTILQSRYQAAIRAIDEMPGSTTERRALLAGLKEQCGAASAAPAFVGQELNAAQKTYLETMMAERLSAYQAPAPQRSAPLDHGM